MKMWHSFLLCIWKHWLPNTEIEFMVLEDNCEISFSINQRKINGKIVEQWHFSSWSVYPVALKIEDAWPRRSGAWLLTSCCIKNTLIVLVPHSQCSLRENPKFLQNFRTKNNTLKGIFWLIFLFNISHCNSGLAFKSKNYFIAAQNCVYFIKENSQKLRQKCKWAWWMRHLMLSPSKTVGWTGFSTAPPPHTHLEIK
jgi:hypothetical protein